LTKAVNYWLPLYHCSTVWLLSWMTNTKVSHTYQFGPEIKYSSKIRKKLTTIVINIAANKWLPNICQNKLWWEVHSYKGHTSIFEEVASEVWALVWPTRKMPRNTTFWIKKKRLLPKISEYQYVYIYTLDYNIVNFEQF